MSAPLVSSAFIDDLKAQYEVFAKFAETPLADRWLGEKVKGWDPRSYSDEAIEKATWSRDFLIPKGMIFPHALKTSCECFGNTPDDKYDQYRRRNHVSAFYDLLHLFWVGYFKFLEALNLGNEKQLTDFISEATKLVTIPKTADSSYNSHISRKNKDFVLTAFVGIYALHLLMIDDKIISTRCRIEAIRLWKKIDPEMKFTEISLWYYKEDNWNRGGPNLLPSSFDPNHLPNKFYTEREFGENAEIQRLFGDYRREQRITSGLKMLLTDHKAELIQVMEAMLRLDVHHKFLIQFLYQIVDLEDGTLALIFGEKASYRNKGVVSTVDDELNHLGPETLRVMVSALREKNKELESSKKKMEEKLTAEAEKYRQAYTSNLREFTRLKIMVSGGADHKGYFFILGFLTIHMYSHIKLLLEAHYRQFSLLYHPDKSGNDEKQKLLNEAVEVFRDEDKFNQYVAECQMIVDQKTNRMF